MFNLLKYIFIDLFAEIIYFPFWWYSRGLIKLFQSLFGGFKNQVKALGLDIWLKSLFKPMYGDYTKEGRIISFFMRLFILIFRLVILTVWGTVLIVVLLIYLGIIPGIIYLLIRISFSAQG